MPRCAGPAALARRRGVLRQAGAGLLAITGLPQAVQAQATIGTGTDAAPAAPARGLWALGGLWDDERSQRQPLAHWAGRPALMSFAYGSCRKTCSTTLRLLDAAQSRADALGLDLDVLVVSLDPTVDTPEAWRQYRLERRLTRPNWHFLSGSPALTRRLAERLAVRYWVYDDHVLHDFRIVAVHPDGHIAASIEWVDQPLEPLLQALTARS